MEKLVTLAVYSNPIEVHIIKGLLKSRGIDCYVYDEMSAAFLPLTVGGIRLVVRQSDMERAQQELSQAEEL